MQERGFTIIELVISIFILSFAIVAVFGAFSLTAILTSNAADRLNGTYLLQEGMELARNIRDTNWMNMDAGVLGSTWLDGLNCQNGCKGDYTSTALSPYTYVPEGDYLYLDSKGFYVLDGQANTTKTKFKRKITITSVMGPDGKSDYIIRVATQVMWDLKATALYHAVSADVCCSFALRDESCPLAASNCVTSEETLYNWYNYFVE